MTAEGWEQDDDLAGLSGSEKASSDLEKDIAASLETESSFHQTISQKDQDDFEEELNLESLEDKGDSCYGDLSRTDMSETSSSCNEKDIYIKDLQSESTATGKFGCDVGSFSSPKSTKDYNVGNSLDADLERLAITSFDDKDPKSASILNEAESGINDVLEDSCGSVAEDEIAIIKDQRKSHVGECNTKKHDGNQGEYELKEDSINSAEMRASSCSETPENEAVDSDRHSNQSKSLSNDLTTNGSVDSNCGILSLKEADQKATNVSTSSWGGWFASVQNFGSHQLDRIYNALDPDLPNADEEEAEQSANSSINSADSIELKTKALLAKLSSPTGSEKNAGMSILRGFDVAADALGVAVVGGLKKIEETTGYRIEPLVDSLSTSVSSVCSSFGSSSDNTEYKSDHNVSESCANEKLDRNIPENQQQLTKNPAFPKEIASRHMRVVSEQVVSSVSSGLSALETLGKATAGIVRAHLAAAPGSETYNEDILIQDPSDLSLGFDELFSQTSGPKSLEVHIKALFSVILPGVASNF